MASLMYGRVFCIFAIKIDSAPYISFIHTFRVPNSQFTNITYKFVLLLKIRNFFFPNSTMFRLVKYTFIQGYFNIYKQRLRSTEVDAYIKACVSFKTHKIFFHSSIF